MATSKEVVWIDEPVRLNMPVPVDYTFRDMKTKAVINLSTYVSVKVQLKREGDAFIQVNGSFVSAAAGTVTALYEFTSEGIWLSQFYCIDNAGKKLWGQPAQFRVVKNVEDAAADELLAY